MKNKVFNKICSFVLALVMALAILPVTAFAVEEADSTNEGGKTETRIVTVTLPDGLEVSDTSVLNQDLTNGTIFQNIVITPKTGYSFSASAAGELNNYILKGTDTNLTATLDTRGTTGSITISVRDDKTSADVKSVDVKKDNLDVIRSYVMYAGTSTVGEKDDRNNMNAQYSSTTGKLTFDCSTTDVLEYYVSETNRQYYGLGTDFTRFFIEVYSGDDNGENLKSVYNFNLGTGKGSQAPTPDTNYASTTTTSPYINLKQLINDKGTSLTSTVRIWIKVFPCYDNNKLGDNIYFTINAGTVGEIKGETTNTRTVDITLSGDNVVRVSNSGELKQTLDSFTSFNNILLETNPGYKFTDEEVATLNKTLEEKGLTAEKTSYYQLTIKPKTTSADIETISATVASPTSKIYTLYNGTSTVGKLGDENKMNAQYSNVTGKLTFNCDTISGIEHIAEDGTRELYEGVNGFKYFYVGVDAVNGDQSKTVKAFNVGNYVSESDKYGSTNTVNPYIDLKQLINDTKDLADADMITITVNACNKSGQIDSKYKKYTFKINVGTVAEIKKDPEPEKKETTPTKKSTSGWDDGSPFTTDTCGNVFDRWGNKIYEAKGCNVGGYNLVRTSVED